MVDDRALELPTGRTTVSALRTDLDIPSHRWLALHGEDLERFLQADEEIALEPDAEITLKTCSPLRYKGSPKHKSIPARGRKGSLCPSGVSGATLLAQSCATPDKPRRRWATQDGFAYCAMFDNANSWHGYPVYMTNVPAPVWKCWFALGKITLRDLRTSALPTTR